MRTKDLAGPEKVETGYRLELLKEPARCEKCSWWMDPDEAAVIVGAGSERIIFCSERCMRRAISAAFEIDLGGEA